jgi:hypothetical protein
MLSLVGAIASVVAAAACTSFGSDTSPSAAGDDGGAGGGDADAARADVDAAQFGDSSCSWFCENFDEATWPGAGWDPLHTSGNPTFGRVDEPHVSPPHAFEVLLGQDASVGTAFAPRTHVGSFAEVRCSFQLQLQAVGTDSAHLIYLNLEEADGGKWDFNVSVEASRNVDLGETNGGDVLDRIQLGQWLLVGFDLRLGTPTRFTVNGVVVNHPAMSAAGDAGPHTFTRASLELGADRSGGSKDWRVDYDDVACDVLP